MKRRILFVHAVPGDGGSTRVALDDARALAGDGFTIGFAADRSRLFDELADAPVRFHRLRFVDPARYSRSLRYALGLPLTTLLLLWIVARYRYDWMFVQHRQSGWPARIVAAITRARYAFIAHSELGQYNRGRAMTPLGSNIMTVSRSVKENVVRYFGVSADRVTVIPNAVRIDPPRPDAGALQAWVRHWKVSDDAVVAVCVAALVPLKGHGDLIAAWRQVAEAVPNALLLFAGDGPLRPSLEQDVEAAGLKDRVRFLGRVRDMAPVYTRADVVVLASWSEGMPLSLLEAGSYGRAVVATSVSGIPEIVADEVSGLLVPPRRPELLAAALIRVLSDPPGLARMGRAGRELVSASYNLERRRSALAAFFSDS